MTSTFPCPARVTHDASLPAAAPAASDLSSSSTDASTLAARDSETAPDFADLCDEASAPPRSAEEAEATDEEAESADEAESSPKTEAATVDPMLPMALLAVPDPLSLIPIVATAVTPGTGPATPNATNGNGAGTPSGATGGDAVISGSGLAASGAETAVRCSRNLPPHLAQPATPVVPSSPGTSTSATPAVPATPGTSAVGKDGMAPAASPMASAPADPATTAAAPGTPASATGEQPGATPPLIAAAQTRGAMTRAAEKSSGPAAISDGSQLTNEQKHSLDADHESFGEDVGRLGTGTALPADAMKPAPQFASRSLHAPESARRAIVGEEGGANGEFAFWKGWTNGGGERSSTAAQFSRLTDHVVVNSGAPTQANGFSATRAATPAAPVAPAYPTEPAALLSPLNAAIERLITRGQDELAVTVRFEQGGSLSLKLKMSDGTIATHMQTDVPGLEEALRTSWNSFAQEWNQRGVKLAPPSFSHSNAQADAGLARDGQKSTGQDGHPQPGDTSPFAPALGRRAFRGAGREVSPPVIAPAALSHRARHALRTWA